MDQHRFVTLDPLQCASIDRRGHPTLFLREEGRGGSTSRVGPGLALGSPVPRRAPRQLPSGPQVPNSLSAPWPSAARTTHDACTFAGTTNNTSSEPRPARAARQSSRAAGTRARSRCGSWPTSDMHYFPCASSLSLIPTVSVLGATGVKQIGGRLVAHHCLRRPGEVVGRLSLLDHGPLGRYPSSLARSLTSRGCRAAALSNPPCAPVRYSICLTRRVPTVPRTQISPHVSRDPTKPDDVSVFC